MTTAKTYLRLKLNPHDNHVLQQELYLAAFLEAYLSRVESDEICRGSI